MASSGSLKYWKLALGGKLGSQILDAVSATASVTGLECQAIDVRSASVFSILSGYTVPTSTATDFRVDNNLTGYTIQPGMIYAPYGGYFTDIAIISGQVAYYTKGDD